LHEVGHLIADIFDANTRPLWQRWLPGFDTANPGAAYTKLWKDQKSHSKYGNSSAVEGFAEAFSDYMHGGNLITEDVRKLFVGLGIPNDHGIKIRAKMKERQDVNNDQEALLFNYSDDG
jgi:hypothetical protein